MLKHHNGILYISTALTAAQKFTREVLLLIIIESHFVDI